jgi:hypothetical protein
MPQFSSQVRLPETAHLLHRYLPSKDIGYYAGGGCTILWPRVSICIPVRPRFRGGLNLQPAARFEPLAWRAWRSFTCFKSVPAGACVVRAVLAEQLSAKPIHPIERYGWRAARSYRYNISCVLRNPNYEEESAVEAGQLLDGFRSG